MNEADMYALLEKAFVTTFFDEVTPGIFHNFANPLNGIMGRSKLLQKRMADFVMNVKKRYPGIEEEMGAECAKLISDVNAINGESEKMFGLFRISAWKYSAMGAHDAENLNVSHLIESELGFADFCLDFKHNVKKEIRLDKNVPDISGVTAVYSMSLWTLIRHAMKKIGNGNNHSFFIATDHDDHFLTVKIRPIDHHLFDGCQELLFKGYPNGDLISQWDDEKKSLCCALLLLKRSNEGIHIVHDKDTDTLSIGIPYKRDKRQA